MTGTEAAEDYDNAPGGPGAPLALTTLIVSHREACCNPY